MPAKVLTGDIRSQNFKLSSWQDAVLQAVRNYDEISGSEVMQQLSEYDRNRECAVRAKWPKGAGHTTLAAYLSVHFDAALIYFDARHLWELNGCIGDALEQGGLSSNGCHTEIISVYHLYHDISKSNNDHSAYLGQERSHQIIASKSLVVVDRATEVLESNPLVSEWLFGVAQGQIVLLG